MQERAFWFWYNHAMLSLRRLVVISRPITYIPSAAVYISGFIWSRGALSWEFVLGLFLFTLPINLIVYGTNDIADRESDAMNPRKGGVYGAVLKQDESRQLSRIVAWTALLSVIPLLFLRSYAMLAAILIIYLFAYTYSVPPVRLKSRPGFDSLSNGIWIAATFLAGYWTTIKGSQAGFPPVDLLAAIILCAGAYHALTSVTDYEVDIKNKDRTISVALGKTRTFLLCAICFFISFMLIGYLGTAIAVYLLLSSLVTIAAIHYSSATAVRRACLVILALLPVSIAITAVQWYLG